MVASDRDYDSAIEHARSQGVQVERISPLLAPLTATRKLPTRIATAAAGDTASAKNAKVLKRKTGIAVYAGVLRDLQTNRPGTLAALRNRIRSRLGDESSSTVDQVIDHLLTMDLVEIQGDTLRHLS